MMKDFKAGDRIAILGANSPEWVIAMYAIWSMHAIAVPIDFMSAPEDIAYILDDCAPVAIWSDAGVQEKLADAIGLSKNKGIEVLRLENITKTLPDGVNTDGIGESDDSDVGLIIYTSGTTGSPKGVMLTFGNMLANTTSCSVNIKVFIPEDRVVVILPLHHAYPLMGSIIMPLSIGATAVFAQGLNANAILAALQSGKCTFIIGVPRLLELFRNSIMRQIEQSKIAKILFKLCAKVNSLKFSRLIFKKVQDTFGGHIRYISCGGAASDPQVVRDFYTLGFEVLEGYGMTEAAPMISFTPPGQCHPGSAGKPIYCNVVRIKDGEVLIKGDNVMKGYYGRPEETAQIIDEDGWLHTGDLGYLDKDDFLFLTGRSKELIILGNGKNIIPYELEYKLMDFSHGLLSECVVSDDDKHLVAVVVPDMEVISARGIVNIRQTIMDEIIEPFNEAVPSYKRMSSLVIQNKPLPRTRLGKVRRHIIRQEIMGEATGDRHVEEAAKAPETKTYKHVALSIEKLAGREIGPDEHLELDIGLDSLGKLSLLSSLNTEWGLVVPVEMLAKYPTPRSLAQGIDENPEISAKSPSKEGDIPKAAWTHGMVRTLSGWIVRFFSKVTIKGKENIPDGACIFAANHQSVLDGLYVISSVSSKQYHSMLFYVFSKFIEKGVNHWFARRHNMVPMELNGDLRQSIGILEKGLASGKTLLIFPEGTRSMDGSLSEFRPTFAQMAIDANVPIVPIAIDGAFNVLPRGKRMPSFGHKVTISFLPPIKPAEKDKPTDLSARTKEAIQAVQELSN